MCRNGASRVKFSARDPVRWLGQVVSLGSLAGSDRGNLSVKHPAIRAPFCLVIVGSIGYGTRISLAIFGDGLFGCLAK